MALLHSVLLASLAWAEAALEEDVNYACWPGQGQGWVSYGNGPEHSFDSCAKRCTADAHCFGFDYTNHSQNDACRLYPPNNPKLFDGWKDHRRYCAKSQAPEPQPADKVCPRTMQEEDIATYVELRVKSLGDGSIKKQIQTHQYTVDSLSQEMYTWWVQLGLASHGEAIDNFENMLRDAGLEQQHVPSKNWGPIVAQWIFPMLLIANMIVPELTPAFFAIQMGLLAIKTVAFAVADPDQGGSTDFLKAARMWRARLPDRQTNHLLMIHNFTNALRTDYSTKKLLAAYDAVTKLINGTQSYRHVLNAYYAAYLNSSTSPSNGIHPVVDVQVKPFGSPSLKTGALWPAAPWKLNGCVIADAMMRENHDCIDSSTPVLGEMWQRPLLFVSSQQSVALEYSCDHLGFDEYVGCWDHDLVYHSEKATCSHIASAWQSLAVGTGALARLEHICKSTINASTRIVTGSWGLGKTVLPKEFSDHDFMKKASCTRPSLDRESELVV